MAPKADKLTKVIDGMAVPYWFPNEGIRSVFRMVPREKDLFVASYPKTGTTWMQYVLYAIKSLGKEEMPDLSRLKYELSPFLDFQGADFADRMESPRVMCHHFPTTYAPFSLNSKTIYTIRNPLDTIVSYYHFHKSRTAAAITGDAFAPIDFPSLDQYFDLFLANHLPYGDFLNHVLSWYRLKEKYPDHILIIRYEDMLNKTRETVLEVARFISDPSAPKGDPSHDYVSHLLANNEAPLKKVIECTQFNKLRSGDKGETKDQRHNPSHKEFFRKGIAGDYKNHLGPEQIARVKEWMKKRLEPAGLGDLWADVIE